MVTVWSQFGRAFRIGLFLQYDKSCCCILLYTLHHILLLDFKLLSSHFYLHPSVRLPQKLHDKSFYQKDLRPNLNTLGVKRIRMRLALPLHCFYCHLQHRNATTRRRVSDTSPASSRITLSLLFPSTTAFLHAYILTRTTPRVNVDEPKI